MSSKSDGAPVQPTASRLTRLQRADRGGVIGCHKSVIRTRGTYLRELVTGEFYARVMVP